MNPLDYPDDFEEEGQFDTAILATVAILGVCFAWNAGINFYLFIYIFTESEARWELGTVTTSVTILLLPIAAILTFLRKKAGWLAAVFYFSSQITESLLLLFKLAFPTPVLALIVFGIALWTMAKPGFREIYKVSGLEMTITIVCGVTVSIIYIITVTLF